MSDATPPTVSRYLLDRIAATGVTHVFGVPGDYNLTFLDRIEAHPQLRWVGNANELNAAYMADGYARLKGFAAVVTTYGVGELSAMNGIAGAYAENVPVLHIVGTPTCAIQRQGLPVHHSLLDGDHQHFVRAAREVTCAAASLTAADAAGEIDRVIAAILHEKRPGYLALPSDLVTRPCPARTEPDSAAAPSARTPLHPHAPAAAFGEAAARLLREATRITVLVDGLARRYDVGRQVDDLIRKGRLTAAVTTGGKGVIDESQDTFAGLYIGAISAPGTRAAVEDADVVIGVGLTVNDLNTGGFTARVDPARLIDLQPHHATVGATRIDRLPLHQAIDELGALLSALPDDPARPVVALPDDRARPITALPDDPARPVTAGVAGALAGTAAEYASAASATPLTQDVLWRRLGRFLRPGDIVAADQGTPFYGLLGQRLPADVEVIAQPGWSSIGYSLPAIAGAQLATAARRRAVLVIGDGAAQLTVQEFGTIAREGLDPIIIVVNNDGYTVERAINGPNAAYNDIARWEWQRIPAAFGADATCTRVRTVGELDTVLTELPRTTGRIRVVEAVLDRHDLPQVLRDTCVAVATRNAG
ncbi:alpha-keto acid decarboxylase family protein [Actinacidiphila guanduensis]|uniref:Alpha-keto-acid decarboxylase n=1 Tax=Actinacidiphila guanduensis TaxID=310781 RepID=A0A1H0QSZ8_9ACTN|nr:thiamine pyrophosphate-binding protein [Actinacidiphila guanduensis]SDP19798.1 indolepyruvate decarboxylase [Actinacidiphila guanduensis]